MLIEAEGEITLGSWVGAGGPKGLDGYSDYNYNVVKGINHGALLYRIGSGNWAAVGDAITFVAPKSGRLEFLVNDNNPANNSRTYSLQLKIIGAR